MDILFHVRHVLPLFFLILDAFPAKFLHGSDRQKKRTFHQRPKMHVFRVSYDCLTNKTVCMTVKSLRHKRLRHLSNLFYLAFPVKNPFPRKEDRKSCILSEKIYNGISAYFPPEKYVFSVAGNSGKKLTT